MFKQSPSRHPDNIWEKHLSWPSPALSKGCEESFRSPAPSRHPDNIWEKHLSWPSPALSSKFRNHQIQKKEMKEKKELEKQDKILKRKIKKEETEIKKKLLEEERENKKQEKAKIKQVVIKLK
ncbi:hypothetical protein QE152_g4244 [Popillia japonica]|uniref:Uncharacterized protein n=1 Tax=Popillia japonica TaxID=7064 RepID=A0AAW1N1L2_POPJA